MGPETVPGPERVDVRLWSSSRVGRVYQRTTVADGAIVKVELTEAAKRNGYLAALPETVVMARPAGLEPTTSRSATWRSIR